MDTDTSLGRIQDIERFAHRTWPCGFQDIVGSWILRANAGFTRRANSCLALGDPGMALGCAVGRVDSWYRDRGLEPCIKICDGAPEGLDLLLAERGWSIATPTRVLSVSTVESGTLPAEFVASDVPETRWLELLSRWDGECGSKAAKHAALLGRMPNARFASWIQGGEILAVGVSVLEGERAHLYDLVVREDLRGKGIGSRFLASLLTMGHLQGSRTAYLQVLETNSVARHLYERMGFMEHHRYHYRVAPDATHSTSGC